MQNIYKGEVAIYNFQSMQVIQFKQRQNIHGQAKSALISKWLALINTDP